METLITPSTTSAIAHAIQQPGISGQPNNMILFEYRRGETDWLLEIFDNYNLIKTVGLDLGILSSSDKGFGYKKDIHIWIRKEDFENANLMILLSYIILGHPDWKKGEIKIYAAFPVESLEVEKNTLIQLASTGRLPISSNNIIVLPLDVSKSKIDLINEYSADADLTLIGFHESVVKYENRIALFEGYNKLGNILFVNTLKTKLIR